MADKPGVASSFPDHCFDNDGNLSATGSANTYAVLTGRRIFGLFKGLRFCARIPVTNAGASTMAVDEATAVDIRKAGNAALVAGDLVAGHYYDFIYDDANNVLQVDSSSISGASVGPGIGIVNGALVTTVTRRNIADISGGGTMLATDRAKRVDVASGTGTMAFTAAATLGDGWWAIIRNNGTGDVTLDPNGAELIDGVASWILYPGGTVLVQCDGTAFYTAILTPMIKVYTVADTFVTPGSCAIVEVEGWGAGGSGGRGATASAGGGGGGGAYVTNKFPRSLLSASISVVVGTGGASKAVATAGDPGGNTTFGAYLTAFGGRGGATGTNGIGGGGGGQLTVGSAAQGGAPNLANTAGLSNTGGGGGNGGSGAGGTPASALAGSSVFGGGGGGGGDTGSTGGAGGSSLYGGGGGGGGGDTTAGGAGGTSTFAGAGGNGGFDANNASNGNPPGGGGGGSETGNSGAGARGEIKVRVW